MKNWQNKYLLACVDAPPEFLYQHKPAFAKENKEGKKEREESIENKGGNKERKESIRRLESIIIDNKLFFVCPNQFNDPIDCCPAISNAALNVREHCGKAVSVLDTDKNMNNYKKHILPSMGITCFTDLPKSIPMWSYYSSDHTGCLLKFSTNRFIQGDMDNYKYICKMKYSKKRPDLSDPGAIEDQKILSGLEEENKNYLSKLSFPDQMFHCHDLIFKKSIQWRHENEWRASLPMPQKTCVDGKLVELTEKDRLVEMPEEALVGIVFGALMNVEDKKIIRDLVEHVDNIKLYEAKISHDAYALEIIEDK